MKAFVSAPGEGRRIPVGFNGATVIVKASDEETGGLCTVWEGRVGPGLVGASPHFHRARDEFFYVLEGELVLRVGDESRVAGPGTFAFIPRGTVHGIRNESGAEARLLVVHHPAGFERYLAEMHQLASRQGGPDERAALAARFDIVPVRE